MEKKLQKRYLTCYNSLIAQDLLQAHYQVLLIIFLKEIIKSNINTKTMIKNVKLKLITKTATTFLNVQTLEMI